nr:MAG TPA: hypothetical protein [Bacteriophage sp.]
MKLYPNEGLTTTSHTYFAIAGETALSTICLCKLSI